MDQEAAEEVEDAVEVEEEAIPKVNNADRRPARAKGIKAVQDVEAQNTTAEIKPAQPSNLNVTSVGTKDITPNTAERPNQNVKPKLTTSQTERISHNRVSQAEITPSWLKKSTWSVRTSLKTVST